VSLASPLCQPRDLHELIESHSHRFGAWLEPAYHGIDNIAIYRIVFGIHREVAFVDIGFWGDPRAIWWGRHERRHRRHGTRRLRRGILKFALLKLLAEVPRHGYDLIREVREKGWGGGAGSVYPLLSALEAAGLISGREEGDRRIYELTEQGRRLLGEHAADLERWLNDEDDDDEEEKQDMGSQLRDSARRLVQAVSQVGPSSKPETIAHVRELLDRARKEIYQALAEE
jgi:DNA-binding PadR family transcriptional regulator